jgi:hypothetical protein
MKKKKIQWYEKKLKSWYTQKKKKCLNLITQSINHYYSISIKRKKKNMRKRVHDRTSPRKASQLILILNINYKDCFYHN